MMANERATMLAEKLGSDLRSLAAGVLASAAAAKFVRIADDSGRLVTALRLTDHQRIAADRDATRLRQWAETVTSVLRRRGLSRKAQLVDELVQELGPIVLLAYQGIPDITEQQWRAEFARMTSKLTADLLHILDDEAEAFGTLQRRQQRAHEPFDVRISRLESLITVTAGQAREIFRLPAGAVEPFPAGASVESAVEQGKDLFRRFFPQTIARAWAEGLQSAGVRGHGLRLQLHLENAGFDAMHAWEQLHDGQEFIALAGRSSIARCLSTAPVSPSLPVASPLRVLMTISSPRSLPFLDVLGERERIEAAVSPLVTLGLLRLDVASDGTLNTVRRMLQAAEDQGLPYHVWHFIGHGTFNEETARGALAMSDAGNHPHHAGGWELGTLLRGHPQLRLAILNACEGARSDVRVPMSGVATALVQCGVPAVIAMQFSITDTAAKIFAEELYGALADGAALDDALREARRGIFFRPNSTEWVTPVLFLGGGLTDPLFTPSGQTRK